MHRVHTSIYIPVLCGSLNFKEPSVLILQIFGNQRIIASNWLKKQFRVEGSLVSVISKT
jgi:hypothetical protein